MAETTTYECDGCGRSVEDPGPIGTLSLKIDKLQNGVQYYDRDTKNIDADLCPSCTSDVKKLILKVLRQHKT